RLRADAVVSWQNRRCSVANNSSTRGSAIRYQSVWPSRRNATSPSCRILARCCDSADCDRPTASASAPTLPSPHSTSRHRIISRRSLASAPSRPATCAALRSSERRPLRRVAVRVAVAVDIAALPILLGIANLGFPNVLSSNRSARRSEMAATPMIRAFFDEPTNTVSYLVADPDSRVAAVIDPVLDYDQTSGEVDTRSVQKILAAAEAAGWRIEWTVETHAHADHLSGSPFVKAKTGAKIGIGEHIKDVQRIFRPVFDATDLKTDGSDFDHLFKDGEHFAIGGLDAEVLYTPGHTPACVSY